MIRLLKIELHKIRSNRTFKVLSTLYIIAILAAGMGVMPFLQWLKRKFAEFDAEEIDPTMLPFYEFPDIWQNLTNVTIYFKILLALSLIYSITNEYTYRTIRQNVIDGLSKHEFIWSKIIMAGFLSLASTAVLFVTGMITGLIYSHDVSFTAIFEDMHFLIGFFLQLFAFLLFTLMLATLVRKPLLTMGLMFLWMAVIENVGWGLVKYYQFEKGMDVAWVEKFLPIKTINGLIHTPFPKYALMEIQDYIALGDLLAVLVYGGLFYLATVRLVVRRDL